MTKAVSLQFQLRLVCLSAFFIAIAVPGYARVAVKSENHDGEFFSQVVENDVIEITGVQVNPTDKGLEIILQTKQGEKLQVIPKKDSNSFIADIPNSQLRLQQGDTFTQDKPVAGISSVNVSNLDTRNIRVMVTAEVGLPKVELFDSPKEGLIFSVTPVTSSAQQQPKQPSESENDVIELIVTAQKREQNVQEVPISITTLREDELEDANTNSIGNIAANTPNFSINSLGGDSRYFTNYSIRGLSNFNFLSRDAVGFYVDDIPYDYGSFINIDLIDLERIEVLKGPQSTLYGRNSQAGVVNIITRKPSNSFEYRGSASYGSYDSFNTQASVSGPLVEDKLFFRLSGGYSSRDGYIENTLLNKDFGRQSGGSGSAQLFWNPSEDWEISFNSSFNDYDDGPPVTLLRSESNIYQTEQDYDGFNRLNSNTQSLKVTYDNPNVRVTSITARRFSNQETKYDVDATANDIAIAVSAFDSTLFSQELRLQSSQNDNKFQWLIGSYFESRDFNANGEGFIVGVDGSPLFGSPPGRDRTNADTEQTTYAVFGQASYQLSEALSLTTGLRYESVNSKLENRSRDYFLSDGSASFPILSTIEVEQKNQELLPSLAMQYRFSPNVMLYGSVAKGYKPSGVNYRAANDETLRYATETSWNYEVGLKTSWLDNRLTANLALFNTNVDNYQVSLLDEIGIPREIANAQANIKGLELEVKGTPVDGFDIIAGLGLVDAKFTDYTNPFTAQSFNGNNLPFSPSFTYNLALQYRNPTGLFGRVELQGIGKTYFADDNAVKQDPYAIVNARIGYEAQKYGVYLFANNLFNTEYTTNGYLFIGQPLVSYGTPVVYGVQLKAKF
ncbi:TonB-dependent receptor [Calothrix parasitica NIES-267]|uniref:TonB-dependent receptor n=1 Tax=Calothrix parasitica NIES-267 TaxID=1973488 RepID=A0A1Z4LKI1_9CYAN|nr:TonB-dependent receptor [Calothrix parasitica NIES-267]